MAGETKGFNRWFEKVWRGFRLRCPHCGQGHIMRSFTELKEKCPHCDVRFERDPGEGTGAMMILLSLTPLPMILLYLILRWLFADLPLLPVTLAMSVALVVIMVFLYRHARGVWLGIIEFTSGLYTDAEFVEKKGKKGR